MRLEPGSRVGAFRLLRVLGEGGMGVVFEARDEKLGRTVALKVIRGEASAGARARFEREIQAACRVRHPNLVTVHGSGEEEGVRFLVSELVAGESLAARLARGGALSVAEAAAIGEKLARALHALHEGGVVHRDVKPGNVLIDERGEPRLTDFGLARIADSERLTKSNAMLGTPAYAPLEQLGRGSADSRADVYALGATLYHMLAGHAPFDSETLMGLVSRKLKPAKRPSEERADRDARLDQVCLRCLEPEPSARFASAAAVADALALAMKPGAPGPRGRRGLVAALLVVGTGAAVAAGAFFLRERSPPPPPAAKDSPPSSPRAGPEAPRQEEAHAAVAWREGLAVVDQAFQGKASLADAVAAVASLSRPDGPLDESERARGRALIRAVDRILSTIAVERGVMLAGDKLLELAHHIFLLARVAPGVPLPGKTHDKLVSVLSPRAVHPRGIVKLAQAVGPLAADGDPLLVNATRALARTNEVDAALLEGFARRIILAEDATDRLFAHETILDTLVMRRLWADAVREADAVEAALEPLRETLGEHEAPTLEAKLLFVRAQADLATNEPARALRRIDEAPQLEGYLRDGFALGRMLAHEKLGRNDRALEAGLVYARKQPVPGRYTLPIIERMWAIALADHRVRDLRPLFETVELLKVEDPVWQLRFVVFLVETGDDRGAAKRYEAARHERGWPSLAERLARGDTPARDELRELERRLSGERK